MLLIGLVPLSALLIIVIVSLVCRNIYTNDKPTNIPYTKKSQPEKPTSTQQTEENDNWDVDDDECYDADDDIYN
jgi:hypothetical protein